MINLEFMALQQITELAMFYYCYYLKGILAQLQQHNKWQKKQPIRLKQLKVKKNPLMSVFFFRYLIIHLIRL